MDLHGRALLLLLSTLSVFGGNVTEDGSLDKIGKTLTVFNVVKFPNDPCTATNNYNGTCYTATECKTLGGTATGSCASSFGVCCVFSITCGQTSSQNNTYIEQATYTVGTDADPCTYKICSSGSVSKMKIEFNSLILAAPAGDAALADVTLASPLYTGHCQEDSLNIASPGHASPPEICGPNTGQHMFVPMSDQCVMINLNIGTGATSRSWNMKVIQYEAGNQMAPDGNCLQYHTASSGTFASFAWDLSTYGPGASGITHYTQFHLANQHYNVCFRREQGMKAICYFPKVAGTSTATSISSAASYGLGGSRLDKAAIGSVVQTDGYEVAADTATLAVGQSACQGYTSFVAIGGAQANTGGSRTTGDYLEIPQAFDRAASAALPAEFGADSTVTRVCGNVFRSALEAVIAADDDADDIPVTICSKTTPFRVGVHMDGSENMGQTYSNPPEENIVSTFSAHFDNYYDENTAGTSAGGYRYNQGQGYAGFYLEYFQTA